MGMKTQNIRFKMPNINPQSNPNKFGGEKRSPRGCRNGGRRS